MLSNKYVCVERNIFETILWITGKQKFSVETIKKINKKNLSCAVKFIIPPLGGL